LVFPTIRKVWLRQIALIDKKILHCWSFCHLSNKAQVHQRKRQEQQRESKITQKMKRPWKGFKVLSKAA